LGSPKVVPYIDERKYSVK